MTPAELEQVDGSGLQRAVGHGHAEVLPADLEEHSGGRTVRRGHGGHHLGHGLSALFPVIAPKRRFMFTVTTVPFAVEFAVAEITATLLGIAVAMPPAASALDGPANMAARMAASGAGVGTLRSTD